MSTARRGATLADTLEMIEPTLAGQRWGALLADVVRVLRKTQAGIDVDCAALAALTADELAAFRKSVYDAVEARLPWVATSEARLLADWFAALAARVSARDQRRSHEALRRSERRFRQTIEHSTVAVWEFDLDGRITWVYNSKLPEALGVELVGRRINELMSADESAALDEAERHALQTGARTNMHVSLYLAGERFHRLFSFEVLRDDDGEPIGFIGSSIDTTELRRAEAELSRAVAFREQLMGILGHDLRNPVSAVRGIASLLQLDRSLPPKVLDGLVRIEQVGRRMSEMIETVLDFTRIRFHHQLPVSPSDMDFGELCRNVVDEVLAAHPGREVELEAPGDLRGHWDYPRMAQVVSNLLSNALTHGDGEAPVRLIVGAVSGFVTLDVVNRGPTIAPELLKTLFEPFVQGPATGMGKQCGLGLGLYIAHQIVASHGGTLTAQSDEGATTFTVRLCRQRTGAGSDY